MKRRQAITLTATILGGSFFGSQILLSGCKGEPRQPTDGLLSQDDILLLDEIGETILPATASSPGAKAAQIGQFMNVMVTDCYEEKEQAIFQAGLKEVEERSKAKHFKGFMQLSSEQRLEVLASFDAEARQTAEGAPRHFFSMMKDLTQTGYFSSEPGVTQALRYNPIPKDFIGCVDYKGEKAWY